MVAQLTPERPVPIAWWAPHSGVAWRPESGQPLARTTLSRFLHGICVWGGGPNPYHQSHKITSVQFSSVQSVRVTSVQFSSVQSVQFSSVQFSQSVRVTSVQFSSVSQFSPVQFSQHNLSQVQYQIVARGSVQFSQSSFCGHAHYIDRNWLGRLDHKVPLPYPCEYTPATRQRPQGGRGRKSGGQPSHTGLKTSIESGGQPRIDTLRPARAANEGCWSTTAPRCRSQAACRLCRSRCCKCRNVVTCRNVS
jgi:hypothetical protein